MVGLASQRPTIGKLSMGLISGCGNRTFNQKPTIDTTKITGNIIQAWKYCKLLTIPPVLRKDDGIARFFNENRAAEFIGNMEEAKAPFS